MFSCLPAWQVWSCRCTSVSPMAWCCVHRLCAWVLVSLPEPHKPPIHLHWTTGQTLPLMWHPIAFTRALKSRSL